jgi:threonine dehydrogenase-like Zn-dependent dehydrogenase
MEVSSLWHLDQSSSAIRTEQLSLDDSKVFLKSQFSFVSLGTERLVASGKVPSSLHQSMQVPFMQGNFNFPIKYGYSLVAKVEQANHHLHGKYVHLLHPHQDRCAVPESALSIIPHTIPSKRAILASNVETAVNAIWDSGLSIGDRILVVGFGNIGALVALIARQIIGVEVVVAEKNLHRSAFAKQLGFSIYDEKNETFDIAFNTSANAKGLQLAINQVGFEGKVIELSWYGEKEVNISLGSSFHQERKQIISSQVGVIPTSKTNRWSYTRRKKLVWKILEDPIFDQLLTNEIEFGESPKFFEKIRYSQPEGIGFYLSYGNLY